MSSARKPKLSMLSLTYSRSVGVKLAPHNTLTCFLRKPTRLGESASAVGTKVSSKPLTAIANPLSKLPVKSGVLTAITAVLLNSGYFLRKSPTARLISAPWVSAKPVVTKPTSAGALFPQMVFSASMILSSAPIIDVT